MGLMISNCYLGAYIKVSEKIKNFHDVVCKNFDHINLPQEITDKYSDYFFTPYQGLEKSNILLLNKEECLLSPKILDTHRDLEEFELELNNNLLIEIEKVKNNCKSIYKDYLDKFKELFGSDNVFVCAGVIQHYDEIA